MLSVAIVDDEQVAADKLKEMLEKYVKEQNSELSVEYFKNPVVFITQYTKKYDLIMLDIEMPEMNGLDLARKLREVDEEVSLIFVTNMKQYAINGYEVGASDFIVKPLSYYDFAIKLNRILKKKALKPTETIAVKVEGVTKYLSIGSIIYVEVSYNHKLLYHTLEGDFEAWGTIKKMEPTLTTNGFLKCNNFSLINPRYVIGVNGYNLLVGVNKNSPTTIAISRFRKKDFLLELNKYLGVTV